MKARPLRERLGFAAVGLRAAYLRERSFRVHCRFALAAAVALLVLMHPGLHPEIKAIKDMAAGAVLVMSLAVLAVAAALMIEVGVPRIREWMA